MIIQKHHRILECTVLDLLTHYRERELDRAKTKIENDLAAIDSFLKSEVTPLLDSLKGRVALVQAQQVSTTSSAVYLAIGLFATAAVVSSAYVVRQYNLI